MAKKQRFWEIDAVRGIAIVSMIIIHTFYYMIFFRIIHGEMGTGFFGLLAFLTAGTFVFIVGVSFSISYSRSKGMNNLYLKYLRRGLFLITGGIAITIFTIIFVGEGFVAFGILHLIGASIILAPFFYKYAENNLLIGAVFIVIGIIFSGIIGPNFLLPIGIHDSSFFSYDYEPLFPWFGLVLIGINTGGILYPQGKRSFSMEEPRGAIKIPARILSFLGRHSLLIYFLHHILLVTMMYSILFL